MEIGAGIQPTRLLFDVASDLRRNTQPPPPPCNHQGSINASVAKSYFLGPGQSVTRFAGLIRP